tara:strand:+ start:40169 stop:41188 length:1020 start_codon:yes stop_codon:yes gene_type:complete
MITAKDEATPEAIDGYLKPYAEKLNFNNINEALKYPRFVQIETTRLCNASCPFCPVDEWDKSTPFMADDLYSKIVDELSEFASEIRWVTLQKAGEPLLDKKIARRIKMLKDVGVNTVTLASNASALTEKKAHEILEAGLDELMISIDSVDKENYESLRRGLNYDRVLTNIRTFFAVREKVRPDCIVRVRGVAVEANDHTKNEDEFKRWESFWSDLRKPQDRIYMKRPHNWGNTFEWEEQLSQPKAVYHPCIIPWSSFNISAMGIVALCTQDYDAVANMGDVNKQTILEIWRGPAFEQLRKAHATGNRNDYKMCQGCQVYDEEFSLEKEKPALYPTAKAS